MEGQAERQPMGVNDAAAAIASLLGDSGEIPERSQPEEIEPEPVEEPEEESGVEESAQDSDEDEAEGEPETVSLETLDDVAKALGVDSDELLATLKMRIKVNGEERLVSLKEAQTGQQLEADYRRKTTELAEQRRAIEQEFVQKQSAYQQQSVETAQLMQLAENALIADLNTPQMAELRSTNPAEWNARMYEGQQKLAHIQQARQHAAMQWQQQQQHSAAEQQRQFQTYLAQEQEALGKAAEERGIDLSPETKAKVAQFAMERYGFSQQDVSQVYNHKLVLMMLDAMKGQESEKKAAVVKEKVSSMPKVVPPGKQTGKVQVKAKVIDGLKGKLKQTGKLNDAARLIERLI